MCKTTCMIAPVITPTVPHSGTKSEISWVDIWHKGCFTSSCVLEWYLCRNRCNWEEHCGACSCDSALVATWDYANCNNYKVLKVCRNHDALMLMERRNQTKFDCQVSQQFASFFYDRRFKNMKNESGHRVSWTGLGEGHEGQMHMTLLFSLATPPHIPH